MKSNIFVFPDIEQTIFFKYRVKIIVGNEILYKL